MGVGAPEFVILAVIAFMALAVVWPAARILAKAGFSPWLGIAAILPIGNIFLLWFVALMPWPALRSPDRI